MAPVSPDMPLVREGRGLLEAHLPSLPRPLLVVCGRGTLERLGLLSLAGEADVHVAWVSPLPAPAVVDALAAEADSRGVATVLGLGGGSALDVAKSVALLAGSGLGTDDVLSQGVPPTLRRATGLVLAPTTAGTGSEVTPWASLWQEGHKFSLSSPAALADEAWVDGGLSEGMPPRLTLVTGLDTLAHALEACWGRAADGKSDALAHEALGLVARHLPPLLDPAPVEASGVHRDGMARAALRAGQALARTASAGAHALSYRLTGHHGVDHGLAVGLLCLGLLPVNGALAPRAVGAAVEALGLDSVEQAAAFIASLVTRAGLQPRLGSLGVTRDDLPAVVDAALDADRMANNPGALTRDELLAVLESVA